MFVFVSFLCDVCRSVYEDAGKFARDSKKEGGMMLCFPPAVVLVVGGSHGEAPGDKVRGCNEMFTLQLHLLL